MTFLFAGLFWCLLAVSILAVIVIRFDRRVDEVVIMLGFIGAAMFAALWRFW